MGANLAEHLWAKEGLNPTQRKVSIGVLVSSKKITEKGKSNT